MGHGDIGGGCWVNLALDQRGNTIKQLAGLDEVAADAIAAGGSRATKRVTITFPHNFTKVTEHEVTIELGRCEQIHIEWRKAP